MPLTSKDVKIQFSELNLLGWLFFEYSSKSGDIKGWKQTGLHKTSGLYNMYICFWIVYLPSSINVWWTRIRQVKVKNIEFTRRWVPLLSMAISKTVCSYADNQPQALKNPIFNNVYLGTAVMWLRVFLKWYTAAILVDDNFPNHRVKKLKFWYQIE